VLSGGFSATHVLLPSSTKMTLRLLNLKTERLHGDVRLKISEVLTTSMSASDRHVATDGQASR